MLKLRRNNSFLYVPQQSLLDVKGKMSRPHKNRITGGGQWRQKQKRIDEPEGLALGDLGDLGNNVYLYTYTPKANLSI
jgi:hypothetical protein